MSSRPLRLALRGSRDVLVLALDGADWLHHDHKPHHGGARRQASVPRHVGRRCRQSDFRRTVGVAKLSLNVRSSLLASAWPLEPDRWRDRRVILRLRLSGLWLRLWRLWLAGLWVFRRCKRQFGPIRTEPGNLRLRRTAWWDWENYDNRGLSKT